MRAIYETFKGGCSRYTTKAAFALRKPLERLRYDR
ncbi:hypothetical protein J2X72_004566 [Phyllobacterium sp. 1468]|nr:hypothetical protein [Phyllobacterium sp. 1468]